MPAGHPSTTVTTPATARNEPSGSGLRRDNRPAPSPTRATTPAATTPTDTATPTRSGATHPTPSPTRPTSLTSPKPNEPGEANAHTEKSPSATAAAATATARRPHDPCISAAASTSQPNVAANVGYTNRFGKIILSTSLTANTPNPPAHTTSPGADQLAPNRSPTAAAIAPAAAAARIPSEHRGRWRNRHLARRPSSPTKDRSPADPVEIPVGGTRATPSLSGHLRTTLTPPRAAVSDLRPTAIGSLSDSSPTMVTCPRVGYARSSEIRRSPARSTIVTPAELVDTVPASRS